MSVRLATVIFSAAAFMAAPATVSAQYIGSGAPKRGAIEIGGSAVWQGSQDLSGPSAALTPNPSTGTPSFTLFTSDPSLQPALGAQATVGVYLTRRLAIEGGVRLARPELRTRLADDFEGATPLTATATITQYLFFGSLAYHFGGDRVSPFIAAGGGHLRDVHDGNELIETGTEFHGKAGVKLWIGGRQRVGVRAEAGVSVVDGGFSFEDGRRTVPGAAIGLSFRF